jgi:hypothetical protein
LPKLKLSLVGGMFAAQIVHNGKHVAVSEMLARLSSGYAPISRRDQQAGGCSWNTFNLAAQVCRSHAFALAR